MGLARPLGRPLIEEMSNDVTIRTKIPVGKPLLRFEPIMMGARVPVDGPGVFPEDVGIINFEITANTDAGKLVIWEERIPPFFSGQGHQLGNVAGNEQKWWKERLVSVSDLAGREVELTFRAYHVDGKGHPLIKKGFEQVAFLELL